MTAGSGHGHPRSPSPHAADLLHSVVAHVTESFHWLADPQHRLLVFVLAEWTFIVVAFLRIWLIKRTLRRRVAFAIMPTSRFTVYAGNHEGTVTLFGKELAQVRLRRLRWWTRPGGAIRLRLDSVTRGGALYSMGGPQWARGVIETAGYWGTVLCPYQTLDLRRLTGKGMYIPPAEPLDVDAQTDPGDAREFVGGEVTT